MSIGLSGIIKFKSGKTSIFDTFCVCLSVEGGFECGWALNTPVHKDNSKVILSISVCLPVSVRLFVKMPMQLRFNDLVLLIGTLPRF